jgi:hypothetical protein
MSFSVHRGFMHHLLTCSFGPLIGSMYCCSHPQLVSLMKASAVQTHELQQLMHCIILLSQMCTRSLHASLHQLVPSATFAPAYADNAVLSHGINVLLEMLPPHLLKVLVVRHSLC